MAQSSSEIQYLIDRAAIHDLLTRYFQGLDRGSPEQVRSCFADDVQCHYDERTPTGASLQRGLSDAEIRRLVVSTLRMRTSTV